MKVVADQCNDMMDIGRLEGFEGKITSQGKLLYKGPLNVLDTFDTKSKKVHIKFFENSISPKKRCAKIWHYLQIGGKKIREIDLFLYFTKIS